MLQLTMPEINDDIKVISHWQLSFCVNNKRRLVLHSTVRSFVTRTKAYGPTALNLDIIINVPSL